MTPDVEQSLARLAPDPGRLDRDAVLFAAGRASARPGVGWKLAVAGLAAGHVAWSAAWLWPPSPAPVAAPAAPPVRDAEPPQQAEPESPGVPTQVVLLPADLEDYGPSRFAGLRRAWRFAAPAGPAGPPPGPPLSAGSDPRFLRLN